MSADKSIVFADTGLVFLSNLVFQGTALVLRLFIGSQWGKEGLGLYSVALSVNYILLLLCSFGIPQAAVKFISEQKEHPDQQKNIVTTTILAASIGGLATAAVLYPLCFFAAIIWKMPELPGLMVIFVVGLPFSLLYQAVTSIQNGLRRLKAYSLIIIFNSFILFLLTVLAGLVRLPLEYVVWAFVLSMVISSLGGLWSLRNYLKFESWRILSTNLSRLFRFGTKLMAANSVQVINTRADMLFVGYFLGKTATGEYAIASMFVRTLLLIPGSIQTITYPLISELFGIRDKYRVSQVINRSAFYSFIILLFMGAMLFFYCDDFLAVFFPKFLPSVIPLRILAVFFVLYGTTVSVGGAFASYGRPDISLNLAIASMIVNLMLNVILIPIWGIVGAALATGISLLVFVPMYPILIERILKIKVILRPFGMAFIAATVLAIMLFGLEKVISPLIAGAFLFMVAFLLVFILIKKELRTPSRGWLWQKLVKGA